MRRRGRLRPGLRIGLILGVGAILTAAACHAPRVTPPAHAAPAEVTVMTQNLYLGADISRPIRATQGLTGRTALLALGNATDELRRIVDRTDFGVRSRLIAAEIVSTRPDLIGLQEVALWRHGPLHLDRLGVPEAAEVDVDFLGSLLAELAARGIPYDVVATAPGSDVEAPAFTGAVPTTSAQRAGTARNIRLTIGDVLLRRHDSPVTVLDRATGRYQAIAEARLAGDPFSFTRGWVSADLGLRDARFRFLTTHLESQSADVAQAQGRELLAGPAVAPGQPALIVCDCNSDPRDNRVHAGSSVADSAAYAELTGAGFADQWLARPGLGNGFTALADELLDDPQPPFDHRLDLVLARGTPSGAVTAVNGWVVGDQLADRDPGTGLWPSDHAGVVMRLRIS